MPYPLPGQRVLVGTEYHWAKGALGTVRALSPHVATLARRWNGHVRAVPARQGVLHFVWVVFDAPQIDADGDGPYVEAEIDTRFLTVVAS
jgi:hypothetical protein